MRGKPTQRSQAPTDTAMQVLTCWAGSPQSYWDSFCSGSRVWGLRGWMRLILNYSQLWYCGAVMANAALRLLWGEVWGNEPNCIQCANFSKIGKKLWKVYLPTQDKVRLLYYYSVTHECTVAWRQRVVIKAQVAFICMMMMTQVTSLIVMNCPSIPAKCFPAHRLSIPTPPIINQLCILTMAAINIPSHPFIFFQV